MGFMRPGGRCDFHPAIYRMERIFGEYQRDPAGDEKYISVYFTIHPGGAFPLSPRLFHVDADRCPRACRILAPYAAQELADALGHMAFLFVRSYMIDMYPMDGT